MEGSVDAQGQKLPMKIWKVIGKSMRTEYTFNGMTGYTIIRTDSGWSYSPFQGQKQAEPLTADQVKSGQTELDPEGADLIDYKKKGYKLTYEGKDEVEGSEAYKLEEKLSDSLSETYYIDPDSYYIIRIHVKATVNGKVQESNIDFGDYQKTPEGIVFARDISGEGVGGEVKFSVIKVNTDIDPKLFSPAK